jgi:phospholipid-binding lipoprotein MlaA
LGLLKLVIEFARPIAAILLLGFALAGFESSRVVREANGVYDPFESMNRRFFSAYLVVDRQAFLPAAKGYRRIFPDPVRRSVRNVLINLDSPAIFVNDMLRGRVGWAGTTLLRATINSTAGIGGLFEVAENLGLKRHSNDFGKTMAAYGVPEGPYIFAIPIGPTNARDITGWVVDFFLNPLLFVGWNGKYFAVSGEIILEALNTRGRNLESLDALESSSLDFYAALRKTHPARSAISKSAGSWAKRKSFPIFDAPHQREKSSHLIAGLHRSAEAASRTEDRVNMNGLLPLMGQTRKCPADRPNVCSGEKQTFQGLERNQTG